MEYRLLLGISYLLITLTLLEGQLDPYTSLPNEQRVKPCYNTTGSLLCNSPDACCNDVCCVNYESEGEHSAKAICIQDGCLCLIDPFVKFFGVACQRIDWCYLTYNSSKPSSDEYHCGNHGTCVKEFSHQFQDPVTKEADFALMCNCEHGWYDNPDTPSSPSWVKNISLKCRVENPCETSPDYCNIRECGASCQCINSTELNEPPRDGGFKIGPEWRYKHNCFCGSGFYQDKNVSDYYGAQTCFKEKCPKGPGVLNCSEYGGNEPKYFCKTGYTGTNCMLADWCVINSTFEANCHKAGDTAAICPGPIRDEKDLHCICSTGYSGKSCEKRNYCVTDYSKTKADRDYCGSFGTCDPEKSDQAQQRCKCDKGYVGPQCVRDGCDQPGLCEYSLNRTCQPNLLQANEYSCGNSTNRNPQCERGWDGAKCNIEDICQTKEACNSAFGNCDGCCVVDKTVVSQNKSNSKLQFYKTSCNCSATYIGNNCEHPHKCLLAVQQGMPVGNCSGNGVCTYTTTTPASCICNSGYFGTYCDREDICMATSALDPCNSAADPGNRCDRFRTWDRQNIICNCAPGFDFGPGPGKQCVRNPCFGVTCQHNGIPMVTSPTLCNCSCPFEYHGTRCEFENKCAVNPCNGFNCTKVRNGFTCDCPPILYTPTCEVNDTCVHDPFICDVPGYSTAVINPCISSRKPGEYNCNCTIGWTVDRSIPVANCFKHDLCKDPATACSKVGTLRCSFQDGDTKPTCVCKENEYYFGDSCEQQDPCTNLVKRPFCSQTGTAVCLPHTNTRPICRCLPGFHGLQCQYQDFCAKSPCLNGGTCHRDKNDYRCSCPALYENTDKNCAFENGCVRDKPCKNGFPCVPNPNPAGVNDWNCTCGEEFKNKSDCSERDPCVFGNLCLNGKCTRVNDTSIKCDCAGTPFIGDLCHIAHATIRLDAYPLTANVGEQRVFILIVQKRGTDPTFKIDFGDSFNFEISDRNLLPLNFQTIQQQRGILGQEGITALEPLVNSGFEFYPFTHIYNSKANFQVNTTVLNGGLLSEQRTNYVLADTFYCLPVVLLQNCGRRRSGRQDPKVPTYERKSRFVIESSLYYNDCQPTSDIKFKWNLFRLTDIAPYPRIDNEWEIAGVTAHENGDQKHIIFLPYNLLEGEYWIQLFVYYEFENDTEHKKPVGNLDWCYFNLMNSPPLARIEGGNSRTVHLHATGNNLLVLNASSSIDQNDPTDPKLKFSWSFTLDDLLTPTYSCASISKSSCSASWIEVNVAELDPSRRYTFHVDVDSVRPNELSTSSTATQEVNIVNEGLEIIVKCVENCVKFNPGDTVHIECGCADCGDDDSYVAYNHRWDLQFGNVTKVGQKTYHLNLYPDPLGKSSHEFECNGSTTDGGRKHEGRSALPILINMAPIPGNCSLDQPLRVAFLQEFANNVFVICQGFTDPDPASLPLSYQINAIITDNGVGDALLPNGVLLLHDVFERLPLTYLPMGQIGTNYAVKLQIDVSDAFGLPADTPQNLSIQVFSPGLTSSADALNQTQDKFRKTLHKIFGFQSDSGTNLTGLLAAGDNQRALQLILSFLYSIRTYGPPQRSELFDIMAKVTAEERLNMSDRIMAAIRSIPLYSHLIVKQVMQSLYLLSHFAQYLTDDTLMSCAEQLIQTAKYFRNYVLRNEEVIFTNDIAQLARAGKYAAENIMIETEKRGQAILEKDLATAQRNQEIELEHLYQKDRDYFLEVDELRTADGNVRNDQPETTTLGEEEIETVKRMSSICERAFVSMIHLLEAIASRQVLSTTTQIVLPSSIVSKVTSSVDIFPVEDLKNKTMSGIVFPQEIVMLIQKQNTKAVQLHYGVSEINPYFGDFGVKPDTKIFRVEMKVDGYKTDGSDQWIRISKTEEPIRIKIPFKSTRNILNETIAEETQRVRDEDFASVELVSFDEISDLNPNIKMFHLSLIHGSTFYMVVTTKSHPPSGYTTIEYQAALTQDYRPTAEDFCRQNTNYTRRFSSGETVEFKIHADGTESGNTSQPISGDGNYLDYYIGIWPFDENGTLPLGTPIQFSVNFVQLSCLTRNEDENKWVGKGCEVSDFVDGDYLECKCHHLSIFAGSVVVPPNKIDLVDTVEMFLTIPDNYIVLIAVGTVLGIWLIGHLICYWKDRDDRRHHSGITIMCEIGENFSHSFYLVRVVTGSRISAGTTANVSIQIYGQHGRSKIYVIKDSTLSVLNRGGNDSFLISSPKDLGQLEKIRVWHDNKGARPGWYLRKIIVREVKTGKRWYFFAGTWLSMTYEKDPNIIREFTAATPAELNSWKRRFNDRLVEEFNNSHLWFSLFFRLPSSNFTRCQRWVCSFGILMSHMLFNIMWEGIPTTDYSTLFEVGDFSINLRQVLIGLQIAIVASPVGMILIVLFRRIRKHRIPTLVVWQDRVAKKQNILPNVREEHIFLPNKDGEFKETVIPASTVGNIGEGDVGPRPFSVPSTDMVALESWISKDTRGHGLRPPTQREPDAFVHKVEDKEAEAGHSSASHMLRIGRRAIAEVVRRTDPTAFIYSGHGDFETQFEEEIRRRADENHPWTKLKKRDIQALDEDVRAHIPKMQPVQVVKKDDRQDDMIYHGISLDLCLMSPVYKKRGYFPWWFLYVSWTVAIATIFTCAFFTILFGLSIGRLRSWHWLTEVSFSFVQTVIITQPVRILVMASIFTVIDRKIHASEEDRFQVVVDDGKEQLATDRKLKYSRFQPQRLYPPLSGATLLQLRLKARRRNELKRGLVAMLFHFLAMSFLASIISTSSTAKFAVTSHVRNMLQLNEGESFDRIKTAAEFYKYMNYFAKTVNPLQDYNGIPVAPVKDARYESTMMADNETMILGIPRIRQVRIVSTECDIHERIKQFYLPPSTTVTAQQEKLKDKINCTRGYVSLNEDVGTYNPFWKEVVGNSRSWISTNDVWTWRTPNETQSIMISGKLTKYDAGGYVAELGMFQRKTTSVLNYIRQTKWIDSRTRAVFVEMSVIVPNSNIFADILLMLEQSPAGAFIPTSIVLPLQITFPATKGESWRTWVTISYVGITLYAFGLIISLGRGIIYHWVHYRMGFVGSLWLWLDFAIGASSILSLALAFKFHLRTKRIHERLDTSLVNEFISLQRIAFWDHTHISFFAAIFGLCIIKTWRFLILFLNRFYILALTLRLTARFLIGFMFILVILVVAFACWGVLAFGDSMEQFHSIGHAFLELKHELLQASFYDELRNAHAVIGRFYFLLFGLTMVLVGVNLFVALLASGFFEAKEIARQKRHRETYWSKLMNSKLRRLICGIPPKKNPEQKLPIPPFRLKAMEQSTKVFLSNCLQSKGFFRMKEMLIFCNTKLLRGTGYIMIDKSEKKKRLRDAMNTTLAVSKERLEEMRLMTIEHLRQHLQLDLTPEEVKAYADFHLKLLEIKVKKVRKVLIKLDSTITKFIQVLDREEAEALETKLKAEAEKLKQDAFGWRKYLPAEVLLNTSASQHRHEDDPGTARPSFASNNTDRPPNSPAPTLRRRTFF